MKKLLKIINNPNFKMGDNILQSILFKFPTKYNKILLFKNNLLYLQKKDLDNLKLNSKNNLFMLFNKLRIYYLNYKICLDKYKNNELKLRNDILEYIKNNPNLSIKKKSNNKFNNNNNNKINTNTANNNNNTNTANNTNNHKLNLKSYVLEKSIDKNRTFKTNKPTPTNNYESKKSDYSNFNNEKSTYNCNNSNENNNKINKNKFFEKLFKKISILTHPDKTNNKILNYLFILAKKSIENREYYLILFISVFLNIKNKKLNSNEKKIIELFINNFINKRKKIINTLIYYYNELGEKKKNEIIENNIKTFLN